MNDYWMATFICVNFILQIVFKIKIWIFFKLKHQRRSRIDSQQKISTRTMISWTMRNYLSLAIKSWVTVLRIGWSFCCRRPQVFCWPPSQRASSVTSVRSECTSWSEWVQRACSSTAGVWSVTSVSVDSGSTTTPVIDSLGEKVRCQGVGRRRGLNCGG